MRYLSVCSGIEAASVAWHGEPLNWTPVGFAEVEPFPCAVLAHHYPTVPNLGDITAPDFLDRCRFLAPVDVLIGGTPCQAFSVAGLRNSLEDARGNLTLRFVEIVHAIGAAFTVWENVPGVLNTKDNAFGCFLAGLVGADSPLVPAGKPGRWTDAGLVAGPKGSAAWRILDAQYFGLAQRRRRVFVVFCPRNGANPAEILFESEGLQRYSDPRPKTRKGSAADAPASVDECGKQRAIGIGGGDLGFALRANPSHSGDKGDGGINTNLAILAPGDGCLTPWDSQRHRGHGVAAPAPTLATSDGQGGDRVLRVLAPNNEPCVPCADTLSVGANQTTGTRTEVVAHIGHGEYAEGLPMLRAKGGDCAGGSEALIPQILHIASDQPNAEINTALAATLNCNKGQRGGYDIPATTHSLTQRHDSSEDGTGRGVPLVPVAPTHALTTQCGDTTEDGTGRGSPLGPVAPIAFNHQGDQDLSASENLAHTKRVCQGEAVCIKGAAIGRAPENGPQYGETLSEQAYTLNCTEVHGVAFQQNTRDEVRLIGGEGNLCGESSAQAGMKQQNYVAAFKPAMGAKARGIGYGEEIANTVETSAPPAVVQTMQVRRLTPVECARLQGFPDHYLDILYRGKPAADGSKYKALGNSMATPCILWIGQRIQMVEDLCA